MKKLFSLLLIVLMAAFAFAGDGTFSTDAVWSDASYNGEILTFECTVDSIDTLTSSNFSLSRYDAADFGDYPINFAYKASSTNGTPKVTAYVQGSMDGSNWFVVDTLFTDVTGETATHATDDFNEKKALVYRLLIYGVATNESDTELDVIFYCYKEDPIWHSW